MRKGWRGLGLLLGLMVCASCVDDLIIDLPEANEEQRVIEGFVERDQNNYLFWGDVLLSQPVAGTFEQKRLEADIRIIYNGDREIILPQNEKVKIPVAEFHSTYGGDPESARFQLETRVGADIYRSNEQQIVSVPKPDSLSTALEVRPFVNSSGNIVDQKYVKVLVHTPLMNEASQKTSMSWQITYEYEAMEGARPSNPFYEPKLCYVKANPLRGAISIADANEFSGFDRLRAYEIGDLGLGPAFSIGLFFTVVQKSIGEEAIKYWTEVKASNERSGNIYDVFPGRIRSNITNESNPDEIINGYFHVSESDTIRHYVRPGVVDFPRRPCADWIEPEIIDPASLDPCLDCLNIIGSSVIRPTYWKI